MVGGGGYPIDALGALTVFFFVYFFYFRSFETIGKKKGKKMMNKKK